MRISVLSDLALGQQLPDSKYVAVARVFTGENKPYPKVPVRVSFHADPGRTLTTLTTDAEGFVVYPTSVESRIVFTPQSRAEYSFFPVSDAGLAINKSSYKPGHEQTVLFYEVEGSPFSWRPYLIAGGVAILGYLVWANYKK